MMTESHQSTRTLQTPEEMLREVLRHLVHTYASRKLPDEDEARIHSLIESGDLKAASSELADAFVAEPARLTPYLLELANKSASQLGLDPKTWQGRLRPIEEAMIARQRAHTQRMQAMERRVRTLLAELSVELPPKGREVIEEFITHDEYELALHQVMWAILEGNLRIARSDLTRLEELAQEMTPRRKSLEELFRQPLDQLRNRTRA